MTVSVVQFRIDFPEFADTTKYPDPVASFWLGVATKQVDPVRFADLADPAVELYVAHQLVLSQRNQKSAGQNIAPLSSQTIDKISFSYDTSAVKLDNAGHWNGTSYGQQFWQLLMMAGAGGVQL